MAKALVKFSYRQVIDANSTSAFDKSVFNATYQEFLLKSQAYNLGNRFKTFSEMKQNDGRANSLHYKLSFAALHLLQPLNNTIPQLKDNSGRSIKYDNPRFELIESNVTDKLAHTLAIHYTTAEFTLMETAGEYMVLTAGDEEKPEIFTLRMQPELSIVSYKELLTGTESSYTNGREPVMMYNIQGARI